MSRYGRRRGRGFLFGKFYINPAAQYTTTVISAIVFAGFVFSGFLLFRYSDSDDLVSRGKRLMEEGKVAWAAKVFQSLVSSHHDSYEGHLLLGQAYLELGERQKAEQEFRTASALKSTNHTGNEADIAMSKFNIARKDFDSAELALGKAFKKNPQDADLREALFELYNAWGDDLVETHQDQMAAIIKYERALRFVREYRMEDKVKEKLIEAITVQADKLDSDKKYEESIQLLKKSLRFRYLPDTLIEIGESYEKAKSPDDAIYWYRKAFDANPSVISIKLSNMLIAKGRLLLEAKKPDEAEQYFNEARLVSQSANVPMDILFPVSANNVKITSEIDEDTGEFLPQVQVKFQNAGARPLNFLMAKATFFSGEESIGEVTQVVASPTAPLKRIGESGSDKAMTLKPEERLNLNLLKGHKLRVRISIAYTDGEGAPWKDLVIQEVNLDGGNASDTGESDAKRA